MTIATQLQTLLDTKSALKQALIDQGLSPTDELSTYAGLIDSLSAGGGEAPDTSQLLTLAADSSPDWTLSEGDTRARLYEPLATKWHHIAAANSDTSLTSGKYYLEVEAITPLNAIGIREGYTTSGSGGAGGGLNAGDGGRAQYFNDGRKRRNGLYEDYGTGFGAGDIIGILFDADTKELHAYLNGVSQGLMYTLSDPTVLPAMVSVYGSGGNELRLPSTLLYLPDGAVPWPLA